MESSITVKHLKIDKVWKYRYNPETDLIQTFPKEIIGKILECVVCGVETSPIVYGSCKRRGHVICRPCYTAYLKEMDGEEERVICPVMKLNGKFCGQKFKPWSFDNGVPPYWDIILRDCVFQCFSSIYGCAFQGPGQEAIEHETLNCEFSYLRRCKGIEKNGEVCKAEFHSAIEILKHYIDAHGFPNDVSPFVKVEVVLKNERKKAAYGENRKSSEANGERILTKIYSIAPEKYCFVVVNELEDSLRLWVTEANPSANPDEAIPVTITVPAPVSGEITTQYQFFGKVLPFETMQCKGGEYFDYFDVPKHFLRRFLKENEDGKKYVDVLFWIGEQTPETYSAPLKEDEYATYPTPFTPPAEEEPAPCPPTPASSSEIQRSPSTPAALPTEEPTPSAPAASPKEESTSSPPLSAQRTEEESASRSSHVNKGEQFKKVGARNVLVRQKFTLL